MPADRPLTLKQLHARLGKLLDAGVPGDIFVETEGCDCDGAAGSITLQSTSRHKLRVYVERASEEQRCRGCKKHGCMPPKAGMETAWRWCDECVHWCMPPEAS